jgi:Ca2+:H+ antiporter
VLLSKPLTKLLDFGVERMGLPTALGGIIVAILILAPEGVAALQAAARNQLQRAVNLSLGWPSPPSASRSQWCSRSASGAAPRLSLASRRSRSFSLATTLFLCQMTFSGRPTNILLSFVHLVLFLAYLMLAFHP